MDNMDEAHPKTDLEEPIPSAEDAAAAAAKLMVNAFFDAQEGGATGPISCTMSPNDDGTVDLSGTDAVTAALGGVRKEECKHCHEVPCFYLQREEEIGNYMEYLFDSTEDMGDMGNKERRFRMYRYLSQLYEGFLGKGNRKELPYCLVSEVRDTFPKEKDDAYTGYKEEGQESS